jgi:chaperonin GroEL
MGKRLFYGDDARARLLEGAKLLYEAVKTTMGPNSGNAVIGDLPMAPRISHDGVTVARAIAITPTEENLGQAEGVELLKEASIKMNETVGDGTTTVTVLAYHLLKEANRLITSGYNPMRLRRELEAASISVLKKLPGLSSDISDKVKDIATISAGDPEIGGIIADVIKEIGKDGAVNVEEGRGLTVSSEIVRGYTFDSGFNSPYFITDHQRQKCVLNEPYIALVNRRIGFERDLFPILQKVAESGHRELLIIADAVESEALAAVVLNNTKGTVKSCIVHAPGGGDGRKHFLEDIAALTNGKILDTDNGEEVQETAVTDLGRAKSVVITKNQTTIIGGAGNVDLRVEALSKQIEDATDRDKTHLEERRAGLLGRVAVITVGGATQTELEERKYRVDDAVCAVRAALKDGIVPGGETTFLHMASLIKPNTEGAKLLIHALQQPVKELLKNAGYNQESLVEKISEKGFGMGVDAHTGEIVDLIEAGIIDPALVIKEAIKNSVSVAGTGMTMGVMVVEEPNEDS